jgi:predicted transcriptional regulator
MENLNKNKVNGSKMSDIQELLAQYRAISKQIRELTKKQDEILEAIALLIDPEQEENEEQEQDIILRPILISSSKSVPRWISSQVLQTPPGVPLWKPRQKMQK